MDMRARVRGAIGVTSLLAVLVTATGCQEFNPLSRNDFVVHQPAERLRRLDPINLAERNLGPAQSVDDAVAARGNDWSLPMAVREGRAEIALAEARAAAIANNLDLRVALYDPTIAETRVDEERARFEALLTMSARRTRTDTPTASQLAGSKVTSDDFDLGVRLPLRTGGTVSVNLPLNELETNNPFSTLNPANTADLSFSISQPLLRNAGNRVNTHGIRVASYNQEITEARTKLEAIRVLANVDRLYWNLYAARKELEARQQEYELAMAQLERAQRLVRAGEAPQIEVLRAESGVAQRMEGILVAANDVRRRQRELKLIMNRDDLAVSSDVELIPTSEPTPLLLDLDAPELVAFAMDHRMEMLELEIQLAIDASTIDFEKNQALPLFTLDYRYNINGLGGNFGNAFDLLATKDFEDWSLGVSAEIPLGNEAAKSRVHRALLERVQRLSTRIARERQITQEVIDAVEALETTWQRILAARQASILAGRTLQAEQRQFDVGLRTSTDVLDAATALRNAQLAEIRALADYQIAQVDVAFATGTLLGHDQVQWQPLDLTEAD